FGIPPVLLGVMTPDEIEGLLEKHQQNNAVTRSTSTATSHKHAIDIGEYQEQFAGLWAASLAEQNPLSTALAIVDELYRELPYASHQQADIQGLLCDYHQLISMEWCEQSDYDVAIEHLNKALYLAASGEEQQALVLKRRGDTLWKADRIDEAL